MNYSNVARRESGASGVQMCCLRQEIMEGLGAEQAHAPGGDGGEQSRTQREATMGKKLLVGQ